MSSTMIGRLADAILLPLAVFGCGVIPVATAYIYKGLTLGNEPSGGAAMGTCIVILLGQLLTAGIHGCRLREYVIVLYGAGIAVGLGAQLGIA